MSNLSSPLTVLAVSDFSSLCSSEFVYELARSTFTRGPPLLLHRSSPEGEIFDVSSFVGIYDNPSLRYEVQLIKRVLAGAKFPCIWKIKMVFFLKLFSMEGL